MLRIVRTVAVAALLVLCSPVSAQISNVTVKVQWDPNPADQAVTQYTLVVDGGAPITVLPAACTPTVCEHVVTLAFAQHTFSLTATNQWGTSQPPTVVTANLSIPGAPGNLRIVR